MMKRHGFLWPVVALALVSCGKPKPREVTEFKLDDKVVELKSDALSSVTTQLRTLCEFADFVSARARERAQSSGTASVTVSAAAAAAPAGGQAGPQVKRSEQRMSRSASEGSASVTTATTVLALGDTVPDALGQFARATGKSIDPQAVAALRTRLDSMRSGWSVATFYQSDTAPLEALKSFNAYTYERVKFTATSLECVRESAEGEPARR